MKPKPIKAKKVQPVAMTTVTLAEVKRITAADVEALFRMEAGKTQQPPLLFEIRVPAAAFEDPDVYRFMYENKILAWPTKDPKWSLCNFSHKDDAKFLRDVLIRHGFPCHISYGPDHRRVLGEIK